MKIFLGLLVLLGMSAHALAQGDSPAPDLEQSAERIIQHVNRARQALKGPPLTPHPQLTAAARAFVAYLAQSDRLSHEADGTRPEQRARRHGYDYCIVSENIAYEFNTAGFSSERLAQELVEGWQRSPGHRRNLLDPEVNETGVALARSEKSGRYYAVQLFGRPRSQAIRFRIENHSGRPIRYQIAERTYSLNARQIGIHEECLASAVKIHEPGEVSVTPNNGDRLLVATSGAGVSIRRAD
jgi:uncharacterized protein YkwD